jgi:hypothetical protein
MDWECTGWRLVWNWVGVQWIGSVSDLGVGSRLNLIRVGLDWIGLDWIGLDWIGLDWIGVGLDWIGKRSGSGAGRVKSRDNRILVRFFLFGGRCSGSSFWAGRFGFSWVAGVVTSRVRFRGAYTRPS